MAAFLGFLIEAATLLLGFSWGYRKGRGAKQKMPKHEHMWDQWKTVTDDEDRLAKLSQRGQVTQRRACAVCGLNQWK